MRNPIEWAWLAALDRALAGDATLVSEQDASWGPPLHAAAAKGLDDHAQALLECGADPRARDAAGQSARDCAERAENAVARARIVLLLEAAGAAHAIHAKS